MREQGQPDLFSHRGQPEPRRAHNGTPGWKATGTSHEAAKRTAPAAPGLRRQALVVLKRHPGGLTPDEIAERVGQSVLSMRPRITELKLEGHIEKTGERRKNASGMNAACWRITQAGREALE